MWFLVFLVIVIIIANIIIDNSNNCKEGFEHDYKFVKTFTITYTDTYLDESETYSCDLWECKNCGHRKTSGYYDKLKRNQQDMIDMWLKKETNF